MARLLKSFLVLSLLLNVSQCENLFTTEQQKIIQNIIKEEVKDVEAELKKQFEFREASLINQIEKLETPILMNQKSILETLDFVRNPPTSF